MTQVIQSDLFDPASAHVYDAVASRARADESIAQAEHAAPLLWKAAALAAVHTIASARTEFTTDAVWALLDKWGVRGTREPRALGAIMIAATRRGWITKTDRVRPTIRAEAHRNPKAIWASARPLPPLPDSIASDSRRLRAA